MAVLPAATAAATTAVVAAAAAATEGRGLTLPAKGKLLLRLSLLSAVLGAKGECVVGGGGDGSGVSLNVGCQLSATQPISSAGETPCPLPLVSSLLSIVERIHAAEASCPRGVLATLSPKPGGAAIVQWGDPTTAASGAAQGAGDVDAAEEPGVPGFGALLASDPPFGEARTSADERRLLLDTKLTETAVAVVYQLVKTAEKAAGAATAMATAGRGGDEAEATAAAASSPSSTHRGIDIGGGDDGGGGKATYSAPPAVLGPALAAEWSTLLAGILASPRHAKSSPVRRAARKLLLLTAGSCLNLKPYTCNTKP